MEDLTHAEAAVYDRQLRVWGVETQKKLSASTILIIGFTGLAAEVAKNIVLAGVGSVVLVDDTLCSAKEPSNFLVTLDADNNTTVAEASVKILQEMNPLVSVSALTGTPESILTKDGVSNYTVVLLVGQPANIIQQADVVCTEAGIPLYAAVSRGLFGWAFANLHKHQYNLERKKEQKDGSIQKTIEEHILDFVPWEQAISAKVVIKNLKRASPLYPILQVCAPFEQTHKRKVASNDLEVLQTSWEALSDAQGIDKSLLNKQALESYIEMRDETPAINAVLGGVIANDLIKAASGNGMVVINNIFLYSLVDGAGWALDMGKVPIRLKEVVYTLSPFEQSVMSGLWKDLPHKASHYGKMAKEALIYCGLPLYAVVWYSQDFKEKEKQHHRF